MDNNIYKWILGAAAYTVMLDIEHLYNTPKTSSASTIFWKIGVLGKTSFRIIMVSCAASSRYSRVQVREINTYLICVIYKKIQIYLFKSCNVASNF